MGPVIDDDRFNFIAMMGLFGFCATLAVMGLVVGFVTLGPTRKLGCFNLLAFTFGPHLLMMVWALSFSRAKALGIIRSDFYLDWSSLPVLVGTVVLTGGPLVIGMRVLGQRLIARFS